jgi:hypothetical protein
VSAENEVSAAISLLGNSDWYQSGHMHAESLMNELSRFQSSLAEKDETIVALRQAIWDTFAILGGDTDGDKTPNAMVSPPLPDFIRTFARETRKDYDDACAELANLRARCEAAERDADELRRTLKALVDPPLRYNNCTIEIDCGSHTGAMQLVREARAAIAAQHAQWKEEGNV